MSEAQLSVDALAVYLTSLSLLFGLGFTYLLGAFLLLLLPYRLHAVSVMAQAVALAHLGWLYSLLRAARLLLISLLVFVFLNGQFVPKWMHWSLIGLVVWASCIASS